MATQELNVKFKVDASEVTKQTDEAKRKVKSAADQMASDVKSSSQKMESSMKDVSNATGQIASASNAASRAVKNMEGQVASSASKMKKDLGEVAEQVKTISTMQAVHLAGRGLGALGGVMRGAANMMPEDWETGKTVMNVGAAAASGAERGLALGTTIGTAAAPFFGPETIAIGAALGAAGGALAGAASELFESARKQEEAAEELRKNATKSLAEHGRDLDRRERFAGYERENQILMGGIGKTWWQNKSTGQSISGEERIYKVQEARQAALDKATQERDEYIRQHRNDTGDAATQAAQRLYYLDKAVQEAQEHLQALTPVVEAARRAEAEKAKAEADAAEKQKNSESFDSIFNSAKKKVISGLTDEKKDQEHTLADYQRQLQGVISRPAETPSDALTRIGGGGGYASYNNSTAQVQKQIEGHLRSVIDLLKESIAETSSKLEALIAKDSSMSWAATT